MLELMVAMELLHVYVEDDLDDSGVISAETISTPFEVEPKTDEAVEVDVECEGCDNQVVTLRVPPTDRRAQKADEMPIILTSAITGILAIIGVIIGLVIDEGSLAFFSGLLAVLTLAAAWILYSTPPAPFEVINAPEGTEHGYEAV